MSIFKNRCKIFLCILMIFLCSCSKDDSVQFSDNYNGVLTAVESSDDLLLSICAKFESALLTDGFEPVMINHFDSLSIDSINTITNNLEFIEAVFVQYGADIEIDAKTKINKCNCELIKGYKTPSGYIAITHLDLNDSQYEYSVIFEINDEGFITSICCNAI